MVGASRYGWPLPFGGTVLRPDWDQYFLEIARTVALRADCSRRKVGAVIVDSSNRIVSTGYNGAAPKRPGCLDGHCPRAHSSVEAGSSYDTGPGACIALHAEQNAIIYAGQARCIGSTLYVTDEPCDGCWRMIEASGLDRVLWLSEGIAKDLRTVCQLKGARG